MNTDEFLLILKTVCGESNIPAKGRIVNGKTAVPHAYPWLAEMFTAYNFMCGGSIISDKHIVTAGHCVF